MGRRPKRSSFKTFTKAWVSRLMYIAIFDIQLSYILAFMGKDQIAETLSITVVTEIIGVMAVYCMKSFMETRESEKVRLQEGGQKEEREVALVQLEREDDLL